LKLQFENEIRRVTFAAPLSGVRDVQARAQALFPALAARAVDAIRFTYVDGDGDTITVGCDADLREAIGQTSKLTVVATPVEKKDDVKKDDVKPDSSASTSAHPIAALLDAIKADPRLQGLLQSFGIPLDALSSAEVLAQLRSHPLFGHFIPPLGDDDNESDDDDSDSDDKEPVKPVVHNATCDGCQTRIVGLRFKCAACPDFDFCERCYTYKGESTVLPAVSGDFCPACGEVVLGSAESTRTSAAMLAFNKQVNAAIVDPGFIAGVRKKLSLDQREAAEIFGGGVNAFSRYENGKTKPPLALVKLLKVLDRHPDLLDEVKAA